jgi:hypothetical protein
MRKRLSIAVVLSALAAAAAAVSALGEQSPTLTGADGNTQSIAVNISPRSLSATKQTPVTLNVKTKTSSATNPTGVPSPAVEAILDFDKETKIFTKGFPTCDRSSIENTSTEEAERKCKKAKIGSGTAHALLPVNKQVFNVEQTVTAFNGRPEHGHPVIILHTYGTTPVTVTAVLAGPVTNFNKEGYGPRLDLTIPPFGGGQGALIDFQTKIKKVFKYKGKQVGFISSTCKRGKLKARGKFVFKDGESLTPKVSGPCKKKK